MKTIHSYKKKTAGFSLVEIALALGVVGFSLAAVLGLLGAAANVNNESARETVTISMTSQILTELRAVPFNALWDASPISTSSEEPTSDQLTDTTYYFTSEGTMLQGGNAANDPNAVYLCTVKKTVDEASTTKKEGAAVERYNLIKLQLVFTWPITAPAERRQTYIAHANIARY